MDLRLLRTRPGLVIINAAVVDDVIGLILMSIAFSLAIEEEALPIHSLAMLTMRSMTFIVVTFLFGLMLVRRKRLRLKIAKYLGLGIKSSSLRLAIAIFLALLFSLFARMVALHEIVGAFIAGMILRNILSEEAEREIYDFTFAFFALLFFAYLGVKTDLQCIITVSEIAMMIIAFAFIGKILGGFIGALISRLTMHEALVVGIAMNSRAAVELAIASAFYSLGIFTIELFSAIVLMATITSITTPFFLKAVTKVLLIRR